MALLRRAGEAAGNLTAERNMSLPRKVVLRWHAWLWCSRSSISAECAAPNPTKFQNNPQHVRVLANEMVGTKLAGSLGLRVPQTEVVEVRRDLIELGGLACRGMA